MKTKLPKRQASPTPKVERAATYNTREISLDQKRRLLEEARKLSYNIWVDILDCKKNFARERIDMVWDEIMAKFNGECFFTVILRPNLGEPAHLEVCFRTMSTPDYFLWVLVDTKKAKAIVKRWNLQPLT